MNANVRGAWMLGRRAMSGSTRDTKYYGDRLVYEVLLNKWSRSFRRVHVGRSAATSGPLLA
ncbi:hypothetical protein ACH347_39360 [Saccharopolyspora sp. 5N102]|uniref:hypothetical protein n=1 Tax=Saccharopolyspora sp. 5N102 TaxID=3375155 RepID=UPI0037B3F916